MNTLDKLENFQSKADSLLSDFIDLMPEFNGNDEYYFMARQIEKGLKGVNTAVLSLIQRLKLDDATVIFNGGKPRYIENKTN